MHGAKQELTPRSPEGSSFARTTAPIEHRRRPNQGGTHVAAHDDAHTANTSRRARTDALLARAVDELLRERGYAGVTVERVSEMSGVAKTTIYRRWRSKAEMLFDLMIHRIADDDPITPTGSLQENIRALVHRAVSLIATYPGREILPGLLADAAADPNLAERLRTTWALPARDHLDELLDVTQLGVTLNDLHATMLGVPYTRVHLLGETDLDAISHDLSQHLLTLVRNQQPQR